MLGYNLHELTDVGGYKIHELIHVGL